MSDEAQQSPGTPRGSASYVHRPPQRVEVVYPSFADFVVSMGPLLSKLRLFVETDEEVPLGTTVHTEIRLQGRTVLIRAMGEVSGHEEADGDGPAGIHVELRYLDPASAALIDAVLRHGRETIVTEATESTDADGPASSHEPQADEPETDGAEVPESGELNLASWEDEVGNLVELALVDESASASSTEVRPAAEDAPLDDPAASPSSTSSPHLLPDPETSEELENEAADALAVIAAQVMTGSGTPSETPSVAPSAGDVIELDDTRPVPETKPEANDELEDTQPVVEVSDDAMSTDAMSTDEIEAGGLDVPAPASEPSDPSAPVDAPADRLEVESAAEPQDLEDEPAAEVQDVAVTEVDAPRPEPTARALDETPMDSAGDLGLADDVDRLDLEAEKTDGASSDETVGDSADAAPATDADSDDDASHSPEAENESKTVSQDGLAFETSDIVLADVFADDDEPSSLVKPPADDDAFSLDEIPESERDLWTPDTGFDELMFEEPSPSIEMYVSSFGPDAGAGTTETSEPSSSDELEDTAREPALRRQGTTKSTAVSQASASESPTATDLDERLPQVVNVQPLTSVDEGETSFAFGDDTAALLGGLDAWPSDGSSAVTPPSDWPPEPTASSSPNTSEANPPTAATSMGRDATAVPERSDPPSEAGSPAADPLDEPPSEDTVAVRLGHAKSFLDTEEPAVVPAAETAADPLVLDHEMPPAVAAEVARDRLNEMAGRGAVQARQRSWRPLLLLLLLVALAGLALAFDWPAARWARARWTPSSTVVSAPTPPESVPTTAPAPALPTSTSPTGADRIGSTPPPAVDSPDGVASVDARPDTQEPVGPLVDESDRTPDLVTTTEAAQAVPTTDADVPGDPSSGNVQAASRATVRAWQQAWSNQDPDAYLATYAASFVPSNGATRDAWAASRRVRLRAPGRIEIGVDDLRVRVVSPDRVEAWFFQTYETDETTRVTWKQLDLIPEAPGRWRIQRETVRPGPPS